MTTILSVLYSMLFLSLLGVQGKGQYSKELLNLLLEERNAGRVLGSFSSLFPISSKFYNGNLRVVIDKDLVKNKSSKVDKDITVFGGKGVEIVPTKYPISVDITPPNTQSNVCGLILGNSFTTDPILKVQILWKSQSRLPWDLLSVPNNGEHLYILAGSSKTNKRVLLFDPVPASDIRLLIHAKNGAGLKLTVAMMYGCKFPGNIKLSCNSVFEKNPKFVGINSGVPKSISCPKNCLSRKSCKGYKVYASESSICYSAQQALGYNGDGNLFLYQLPKVVFFRDQIDPRLNNGIYCKRSTRVGQGFTFNRVYYDFAIKENQRH